MNKKPFEDYYETLQLSHNAEQLVITKVYRLLAAYYHPDNKQTGDEEKFKSVLRAYEVLSDPARRSRYNLESFGKDSVKNKPGTSSETRQGVSQSHGDLKAKLSADLNASLSADGNISERELRKIMLMALYDVRRNSPGSPQLSLLVLSELLGCSIENLEFSNWYLKEKGFIKISESADFSITIAGVDYVENELSRRESEKQVLSLPAAG